MANLPNAVSIVAAIGSQFNQTYQLLNDDGSTMNITGKIFEFIIRTDPIQSGISTPAASVTSTASTASGTITVTVSTATLLVSVSALATALLSQQQYFYTLWMDQGLSDATALVSGTFFAELTAAQF